LLFGGVKIQCSPPVLNGTFGAGYLSPRLMGLGPKLSLPRSKRFALGEEFCYWGYPDKVKTFYSKIVLLSIDLKAKPCRRRQGEKVRGGVCMGRNVGFPGLGRLFVVSSPIFLVMAPPRAAFCALFGGPLFPVFVTFPAKAFEILM